MADRLRDAVSPYLRSHASNPVDWYPWGDEAFAAARDRDVPVLVSIGYSTCHWCHVMARESFADPALAARLNDGFVAIKVDREEHPDVDAACMTAAGAFTEGLGWPLNVFLTPEGRMFHAGTYSPPRPTPGHASFRQVLDAVAEAWTARRGEVEASAARLREALQQAASAVPDALALPESAFSRLAADLAGYEDATYGGFGGAPKFPVAPVLRLCLALGRSPLLEPDERARIRGVAERAFAAMRDGGLRDPVEGGFFRYATRRDWSVPHWERMLPDNVGLLVVAAELGDRHTADGVVGFLRNVLRRSSGGLGSGQDSESFVDGRPSEGGYYALDEAARATQPPPAVDGKVLTGWNGLAVGALATAGALLGEPSMIAFAAEVADAVLEQHLRPDGTLVRASLDGRASAAPATLEDVGGLADGLLRLATEAGRVDLAVAARRLVDGCLAPGGFAVPGGGDPVLGALGIPAPAEVSEGASPSGTTAIASAAWRLYLLTGEQRYADASRAAITPHLAAAAERLIAAGALLELALAHAEPVRQTVVVADDPADPLAVGARQVPASVVAVVTERIAAAFAAEGFELFAGRTAPDGRATAYVCRDFVCRLPVTDPAALAG